MNQQTEVQILECLKKTLNNRNIRLPANIGFNGNEKELIMTLTESGAGFGTKPLNMQENGAAFEGWAVAIYVHYMKCAGYVTLELQKNRALPVEPYTAVPHYSRFLYRAMKFSDQYSWFRLSEQLRDAVEAFRDYLGSHDVTNNFPLNEAADKGKLESKVEGKFSDDAEGTRALQTRLGISDSHCKIYRQLPVGLFEGEVAESTGLFTGGSSAIDLWTIFGDTLYVIELKADNKMVGALTEVFFYANYVYDMYVQPAYRFRMNPGKADFCGYQELLIRASELRKVKGLLLLDKDSLHPLLSKDVLGALNDIQLPEGTGRRPQIFYDLLHYQLDADVKVSL